MNIITINRSNPTTVEFNMKIDGAAIEDASARFVIHTDEFDISIPCSKISQETFNASVPALPFIETGVLDCTIEVIVAGQVFKPLTGMITIVDNIKVEVSTENKPKQHDKEQVEQEEQTDVVNRVGEPFTPVSEFNITKYLQSRNASEEEEISESVEKEKEKDKKIREILESMNIPVVKKNNKRKSPSLKSLTEARKITKSPK